MTSKIKEREITRKALVICLSHPVDCDCRGCRDIYGLLQPGEPDDNVSDLKPCPFCGGEATVEYYDDGYCVGCDDCPARMDETYASEEEAIATWNRRAEPTPDREAMEERIRELEAENASLTFDLTTLRTTHEAERDSLRAEVNRLTHSLVEAMGERDRLRRLFERTARDVWDLEEIDNGAWQDTARDLGLIVEVPADEDFREEYDADTMYVWAWSPLSTKKIDERPEVFDPEDVEE